MDLASELEKKREKLLDLSNNNKLLNYRKTLKTIQIVDELPNEIYDRLINKGKQFRFAAAIEPTTRPPKNSSDSLQSPGNVIVAAPDRSLPNQRSYAAVESASGAAVSNEAPTRSIAQQALHETSKDVELPMGNSDSERVASKHADDVLQTNIGSAAKLESQLKSIAQRAQTAIEETGVNYLHLAIGVLEWSDTDDSDRKQIAPLILIPVQLERAFDQRSGKYSYKVRWTEDAIQHNLSLERKLDRDFGLKLPGFGDELEPESYFDSVREAVQHKKTWRVMREAFVGFFSFHKLLMYLDANPNNWGDADERELKLANIIMCGSDTIVGGTSSHADEYLIDENPQASRIPLVVDADSSQHSALCDILNGKSLVIEGPPGTGKSQTITNAIAAAINDGKTVLFVAEKLAALEVVQNKLKTQGLEEFCLAIHSDDASPRQIIESLRRRMEAKFPKPRSFESEFQQLQLNKQRLNEYLRLQLVEVGPCNETLNELQWKVVAAREADIPGLPDPTIIPIPKPNAFQENCVELRTFGRMLAELNGPKQSPWWGFLADCVNANEHESVLEIIREFGSLGEKSTQTLSDCARTFGGTEMDWFERLDRRQHSSFREILSAAKFGQSCGNWEFLDTREKRQLASHLMLCARTFDSLKEVFAGNTFAHSPMQADQAELIEHAIQEKLSASCGQHTFKQLQTLRVWLQELVVATQDAKRAARHLELLQCGPVRNLSEFKQRDETFKLGLHPAVEEMHGFHRALFGRTGIETLHAARKRFDDLEAEQSLIDKCFHKESIPDSGSILELEKRLRPFARNKFAWIFKEFRAAKKSLFQFARAEIGRRVADWLSTLEKLREHEQKRAEFLNSKEFSEVLGPGFKGVETNWGSLKSLVDWVHTARGGGLSYEQAIGLIERARSISEQRPEIRSAYKRFTGEIRTESNLSTLGLRSDSIELFPFDELENRAMHLAQSIEDFEGLVSNLRIGESVTLSQLLQQLTDTRKFENAKSELESATKWNSLGPWFQGAQTRIEDLEKALNVYAALEHFRLPSGVDAALRNTKSPIVLIKSICNSFQTLVGIKDEWEKLRNKLKEKGELSDDWLSLTRNMQSDPGCRAKTKQLLDASEDLSRWCQFSRAYISCNRNGLEKFLERAMDGRLPTDKIQSTYERSVYENIISKTIGENELLRNFSRQKHEEIRNSFQQIDRDWIALNRKSIAHELSKREPPTGSAKGKIAEYTEMGLIRHEIAKSTRFCKIRDLLTRAGKSVQTLKPCFMMSPLSVAQYLPPKSIQFDIVIMDEASQIKPEDAIGTILRARQLVVVGDPKQMPPTSFFDRQDEEVGEEDATQMDNTESILEVATKVFQPLRRLRWHYRSKHESLIQFSNDRFYDHDLIIFPSPDSQNGRMGIFVHHVENGTFKTGENRVEAELVVNAIVDHAINHPNESLGVGVFNIKQASLISDLLDKACETDPLARAAVESLDTNDERLFIKNLENLQGDERDVIFISFTYGRDAESGRVFQRFGPMTSSVGWRRFNVLITRARKRLEVFTSLRSSDIQGGPDKERGVNAMKDFLSFCETRKIPTRSVNSGRGPDSMFEESVGRVIEQMGLRYVPQVGVAGYFIDIGILKPKSDFDFLLGIECDGASYHSSKSARDRDRLRQEIIEARGWKIHRIWSTDWFQNQSRETTRLKDSIQACLSQEAPNS